MALLGDPDTVERNLRSTPDSGLNADAAARLVDIQAAVTAFIEERTGRVFGEVGASEAVAVQAPTVAAFPYSAGASSLLILPKAVRTITSVVVDPEWSGSGWTDGTAVAATEYRPAMFTNNGDAMALERIDGTAWLGRYVITGTFEDADDDATVPDEITYVANLLIGEMFKYEQSSAAAKAGPDGQTLPLKNAVKHPVVDAILCRYAASTEYVVV
jgi:hypothetical protein